MLRRGSRVWAALGAALVVSAFSCPGTGGMTGLSGVGSGAGAGSAQPGTEKHVIFFGSGHQSSGGLLQGWRPGQHEAPAEPEDAPHRIVPPSFHWDSRGWAPPRSFDAPKPPRRAGRNGR